MNWVDSHCHLDLYGAPDEIVREIEQGRVYTIAVTNLPSRFRIVNKKVVGLKYVRAALGLHPKLAGEHYSELPAFRELLEQTRYVGEVGLDGTDRGGVDWNRQIRVFEQIVDYCAQARGKILTVHSRRAEGEVLDILGTDFPGKVIMHWYSGSISSLERAIENGFFFSVNPAMVRSKRGRELIARIPKDRILTETDGPFVKVGHRVARPLDVQLSLRGIASLWQVSKDDARKLVWSNFRRILGSS